MTSLFLALVACSTPPSGPVGELIFVRHGVLAPSGPGREVSAGLRLTETAWTPGEPVSLGGITAVAPATASCVPLYSVPLGDVSRLVAMGGAAPDTALALSPDGERLAIGSYTGDVVVVDGWTGAEIARRTLAETMVKQVAWSADGQTLYAAEQSPDAMLRALDPVTLADRWTHALSEEVGHSPAPDGEDVYGVYTLPSAFGLAVLPGGDLLVVATHAWNTADGVRTNRSQVLRLGAEGQRLEAWPDQVADASFRRPIVDLAGGRVVIPISRTADGPDPDLPVDGLQILSLDTLTPLARATELPLKPWFSSATLWEAVGLAGDTLLMGFNDGRVQLRRADGALRQQLDTGVPVMAGDVPIVSSVGFGFVSPDTVAFITSGTNIPWGAAAPELRPPMAHPRENGLWVHDHAGELLWTWSGPDRLAGLSRSPDDQTWIIGSADRASDVRRDLYGARVFDASSPADGRGGDERLQATCRTEGPAFFRHLIADDGRVVLAEFPYQDGDGVLQGGYRVTVLR